MWLQSFMWFKVLAAVVFYLCAIDMSLVSFHA